MHWGMELTARSDVCDCLTQGWLVGRILFSTLCLHTGEDGDGASLCAPNNAHQEGRRGESKLVGARGRDQYGG